MRKLFVFQILVFCHLINAQVTEQVIKDHVYFLSSAELNGRIASTQGGHLAAEYIAENFKSSDLSEFSDSTAYYQYFSRSRKIPMPSILSNGVDTFLVAHLNKEKHLVDSASITIVDDVKADQHKNENVYLKIHAETFDDGLQRIKESADARGNYGYVLLLSNKRKKRFKINLESLKKSKSAHEVYILTNYLHYAHNKEECDDYLQAYDQFNILVASESSVSKLLVNNNTELHITEKPDSLSVKTFKNVIAKIEGTQPNQPALVFCAHYDHVDSLYSRKTKGVAETDFFPGADDNASGTAAVLEIASRLKGADFQPEQDVYFCLFDAEELGLYGSRYFAKEIGQDIGLVINMDMIGRDKKDRKSCNDVVFAKGQGKEGKDFIRSFDKYAKQNSDYLKIRRFDPELFLLIVGYPSDQASFRPQSDASVFYTGLHKDYHTHNDTPDKINYKKLTEYVNLMSDYLLQNWQ
ncbi:M28 family metallopeptidase [Carboxylicivirga sp. M1479]|uniref:M28 family metallopeptidase n=1 Tax=Carboxylicivirga sp. M1479 TaxID=2594476 RepID=UPI001177BCC4|nr:M20/M25/M40 family metallo-hydrolase [Carboxylicivirga sp. M1479]TRX61488.1 M20/M25/M40 family metallo-hydrolase [Carboxylicivirga sp. M1479]